MARSKITYLDGLRLHRALAAGIRQVINRQTYLNKINVFPVPDGDTGTNLTFTLRSVLERTRSRVHRHVGRTAVAIADAAMDGARGNAGVIMAQFLQGFSDSCADQTRLTPHQFALAAETGYSYAVSAIAEPVEGTILSVIRATVDTMKERVTGGVSDFMVLLKDTLIRAEEALQKTPEQLEILRKRGVVDAGGAGFVYMLRGMLEFISHGTIHSRGTESEDNALDELMPANETPIDLPVEETVGQYRFCTECQVRGRDIHLRKLRETLMPFGDSLVIGGTKERAKVHIHTNTPQAVFDAARHFGDLSDEKADDMHSQAHSAEAHPTRVAVVTDSTADIPQELIEAWNIHIVPVKLNFGNIGYLDKMTITADEFYRELSTNPHHPQTSQPTPGDFWRYYQFLSSHYDSIISLHLPPPVSGTWQSARTAARRMNDDHITVMNTRNTAAGLGLIVAATAKAAHDGREYSEVLAVARHAVEETFIFAAIADLTYAVRGGRVARSRKSIADLLRVVPILHFTRKETVDVGGIFFGRRNLARGFARWLARHVDREKTYNIIASHAQAPESLQQLIEQLRSRGFRFEQVYTTDLGTALGAHAGPGALLIAFQPAGLL